MQAERNELTVFVMDDEGIILDSYEDEAHVNIPTAAQFAARAWDMETLDIVAPLASDLANLCADEDPETAETVVAFFTGDFEAPIFLDAAEEVQPPIVGLLGKLNQWWRPTMRVANSG